jgi:mutator protein MutT
MQRGIDYIGVGVGAIILNQDGQVFLAQRGPLAKNERGCWEFPGGSVEFGETLSAALKREMKEEFGIEIEIGDLLDIADHILPDEGQHWVSPTFLCTVLSGEPQILEAGKCSAIGWFKTNDMPQPLSKISSHNLNSYRQWLINHQPQYNA